MTSNPEQNAIYQNIHNVDKYTIVFNGPIEHAATKSLRNGLCNAVNRGYKSIKILFSSTGGNLSDGMALYGLVRSIPIPITMHAIGPVWSIALPVFLAANKRLASSSAAFVFHNYHWGFEQGAFTAEVIEERRNFIKYSADWTKQILKERTSVTDEYFDDGHPTFRAKIIDPEQAERMGIVQGLMDGEIPTGSSSTLVHNLDW